MTKFSYDALSDGGDHYQPVGGADQEDQVQQQDACDKGVQPCVGGHDGNLGGWEEEGECPRPGACGGLGGGQDQEQAGHMESNLTE